MDWACLSEIGVETQRETPTNVMVGRRSVWLKRVGFNPTQTRPKNLQQKHK